MTHPYAKQSKDFRAKAYQYGGRVIDQPAPRFSAPGVSSAPAVRAGTPQPLADSSAVRSRGIESGMRVRNEQIAQQARQDD